MASKKSQFENDRARISWGVGHVIGLLVLRFSFDSNIRIVGFCRFYINKTNQSPYVFFLVVLIGFRRFLKVRIVGFCRSKNCTNQLSRFELSPPKLLSTFSSTAPPVTLFYYNTHQSDSNRHLLHKKSTTSTKFDKKRRFMRWFRRFFLSRVGCVASYS